MNQADSVANNKVVHLNNKDFEASVIQSKKPVLVDFWADWCQPCHQMSPTINALAEEYGDRIRVAKVNVDDNPEATAKYGIRGIPALLLFKEGQLIEQMVGVKPKEEIARIIENNL